MTWSGDTVTDLLKDIQQIRRRGRVPAHNTEYTTIINIKTTSYSKPSVHIKSVLRPLCRAPTS